MRRHGVGARNRRHAGASARNRQIHRPGRRRARIALPRVPHRMPPSRAGRRARRSNIRDRQARHDISQSPFRLFLSVRSHPRRTLPCGRNTLDSLMRRGWRKRCGSKYTPESRPQHRWIANRSRNQHDGLQCVVHRRAVRRARLHAKVVAFVVFFLYLRPI